MKNFINQVFAVAEKEIRLKLRWGKDYFLAVIVTPLIYLIPYFLIYQGIFNLGSGNIGDLTRENYAVWLFLGTIYFTFASRGFGTFEPRFISEKYWMTIQATFLTPTNKYALLIGITIETFLETFVPLVIFTILSYIILPTTFLSLIGILGLLLVVLIASAGIGLLRGGIALINENFRSIIYYAIYFILFFSCYSLPYEILPKSLQFFVIINPFYHGLLLIRSMWFNTLSVELWGSFLYIIIFTILTIIIAVWLFNKLIERFGIKGY